MPPVSMPSTSAILSHPLVAAVREAVLCAAGEAWLVGGAVRDWLRTGQLPTDLDFTLVNCKAEALAVKIADVFQAHLVPLDPVFGIHRIVMAADTAYAGMQIDLADALGNNVTQDLARRDLTVNAMAVSLDTGELIDPHHGNDDLNARRVRMLSKENLLDDPLRLLRVFRLAASIQAEHLDEATLTVVREYGNDIWKVAPERIQYELFRLLSEERCFPYLKQMADCGLLEILIPDLTPMKTIGASGFHHLGLFDHTLELVKQAERLFPECPIETQEWLRQPFNTTVTRLGLVKLGSLLHDIGKPATMGMRPDPEHGTRLTFYRHEEVGEEMAEPWLRKMKVGNDVREHVKKLIRWHLYPCQFGPNAPRKSVLRYYRRMGDTTLDVTMLALADRHSSCGEWLTAEVLEESHKAHLWLMANYIEESKILSLPRLLTGHDIMRILKISPGPELKKWLDILEEMQQLGDITTAEEAERWLAEQKS